MTDINGKSKTTKLLRNDRVVTSQPSAEQGFLRQNAKA